MDKTQYSQLDTQAKPQISIKNDNFSSNKLFSKANDLESFTNSIYPLQDSIIVEKKVDQTPLSQLYSTFWPRKPKIQGKKNSQQFFTDDEDEIVLIKQKPKTSKKHVFDDLEGYSFTKDGLSTFENIKGIKVYYKPLRKKGVRFANRLPKYVCSKPYKYQLVITLPKDEVGFRPIFNMLVESDKVNSDEYIDINDIGIDVSKALSVKSVCGEKLKRIFRNCTVKKFYFQFLVSSSKIQKKKAKLQICDRRSGNVVYLSNPISIYARKSEEEQKFWSNVENDNEEEEEEEEEVLVVRKVKRRSVEMDDECYVDENVCNEERLDGEFIGNKRKRNNNNEDGYENERKKRKFE